MLRMMFHPSSLLLLLITVGNHVEAFTPSAGSFSSKFAPTSKNLLPSSHRRESKRYMANNNLLESITSLFPTNKDTSLANPLVANNNDNLAMQLVQALNAQDIDAAMELFDNNNDKDDEEKCEWDDTLYYQSCVGKEDVERRLRLMATAGQYSKTQIVMDQTAVDPSRNTFGILFHKIDSTTGQDISNSRGCAMLDMNSDNSKIQRISWVTEPATRGGEAGLNILNKASKIMETTGYNPEAMEQEKRGKMLTSRNNNPQQSLTLAEQYFNAWNRRDMTQAVSVFASNVEYEDTAFPDPFIGTQALEAHLDKCSNAFPPNFQIVLDRVANDPSQGTSMVEWHFESNGEALPFTQGSSFYQIDTKNSKITSGIDFIEPAVVKPGGLTLLANSLQTQLGQEPLRWVPLVSWIAYMYIVFFSDGILPGANALQLEGRTWEEVLNLSLNFFLVAPLLNLPFSPSVHPMLEGVFNLLLSWAAMFAGFLSDDRRSKPNSFPMFPIVVGMQFLTSAFLLPYLATRSSETATTSITKQGLPIVAKVAGESRVLPALMAFVGTGSIAWFCLGRAQEYGTDLATRYASFVDLLSIDRVGSSFLVDLAIFALFQGWLVDDDLKRRGVEDGGALAVIGKFVPFFGMAAYLLLRPTLPEERGTDSTEAF